MRGTRYTAEFRVEAIKQVVERGHKVIDVAKRLGVSQKSLYGWVRQARRSGAKPIGDDSLRVENMRLKAELKRTTEERDILKKAAAYFAKVSG